jgi:excisionase family DNA binding protein
VDKLLLTPVEVGRLLGVSRSTVYELLQKGELASLKVGGCRRIRLDALQAYLDTLSQAPA